MFLTSLFSLLVVSIPVFAQGPIDATHNTTSLVGTWSSGSKNVVTGSGFANPANETFTYPPTTGVSYSFTGDGFYEAAKYRFTSNGSDPHCITGVMNWHHGTYTLNDNGSMTLNPFADGFQQIQDPCAPVSNFIETYNETELYQQWRIFTDVTDGPKLHMFQFDGSPVAPQFQVSPQPNMLPTQLLRNATGSTATLTAQTLIKNSNGGERAWSPAGVTSLISAILTVGAASFLL